jgi:hypothetical protein
VATIEEVTRVIAGLLVIYPYQNRQLTNDAERRGFVTAYHRILHDLDARLLDAAALELGGTSKFFPAAAELRQTAFGLKAVADGELTAGDAWAMVTKAIGAQGYPGGMPDHFPPLVKRAVEGMGGWKALCMSENGMADRAHFLKMYDTLEVRTKQETRMLPEVEAVVKELADGMRPQLPDVVDCEDN